jgi:hypothetical protein
MKLFLAISKMLYSVVIKPSLSAGGPEWIFLLLEHMRPGNRFLGFLFDVVNPLVVRMMGANINRRTIENIKNAGWRIKVEERLSSDIVRWIEAEP